MSDEQLASAYRHARASSRDHLSEDEWDALACGEMAAEAREAVLAHVVACAECTAIHRGLLELAREARQFDAAVPAPVTNAPASSTTWLYAGLAAAAAVIAAVVLLPTQQTSTEPDVMRSAAGVVTIAVTAPPANAAIEGRRLAWTAVASADAYDVVVNSADGGRVYGATVDVTDITLPSRVTLTAGTYYWQVRAVRQGVVVGASRLTAFQVR